MILTRFISYDEHHNISNRQDNKPANNWQEKAQKQKDKKYNAHQQAFDKSPFSHEPSGKKEAKATKEKRQKHSNNSA